MSVLATTSLGYAATLTGDLATAREHLRKSADLASRMGWPSRSVPLGQLANAVAEWLAAVGLLHRGGNAVGGRGGGPLASDAPRAR